MGSFNFAIISITCDTLCVGRVGRVDQEHCTDIQELHGRQVVGFSGFELGGPRVVDIHSVFGGKSVE